MNNKQLYFKDNSKSVNIITYGKISNFKPAVFAGKNTGPGSPDKKQSSLRLIELEEANSHLKILLEEQSAKLAEVVATNTKFLSVLAHDLRSPFQAIIGALDLIQDSYNDKDEIEIEPFIKMASNSASTTLRLLENLLLWATLQNSERNYNPVKVDLYQLILVEIESSNPAFTQKLITLKHSVSPGLSVLADLQMVKTIFRNLISNAIKYSFIGGEISVSASADKKFAQITVQDNGIGISHNAQKELFKKNELHSTRGTNNEKGTGLGLILCNDFVNKHGGEIHIESVTGKGSKFKFTLPLYIN